jgi:hypothetical protein
LSEKEQAQIERKRRQMTEIRVKKGGDQAVLMQRGKQGWVTQQEFDVWHAGLVRQAMFWKK